jgi:hypothetical protein
MKFFPRYNFYSAVFNFAFLFNCFAAYELKCPYLINPELNIPYIDSCARFWTKAYDNSSGGFFANVDQAGNVSGGTKFTQIQARDIYAMTHAFMVTGNEEYLEYARNALDWMYTHCWDNANGGWYVEMDAAGNPANTSYGKTYFWEFYSLMGVVTTYEVTRRATDKVWLDKSWETFNSHMWDTRAGFEGYFNQAGNDWSNPSLKGLNPSDAGEVTICRLNGATVFKSRLPTAQSFSVSVPGLNAGVYIVNVRENYGKAVRKIRVE